jgi:hypothetical protein
VQRTTAARTLAGMAEAHGADAAVVIKRKLLKPA